MNEENLTPNTASDASADNNTGAAQQTPEAPAEGTRQHAEPSEPGDATQPRDLPGVPPLGLWEMLEPASNDDDTERDDENSRVLAGLRGSVWDSRLD